MNLAYSSPFTRQQRSFKHPKFAQLGKSTAPPRRPRPRLCNICPLLNNGNNILILLLRILKLEVGGRKHEMDFTHCLLQVLLHSSLLYHCPSFCTAGHLGIMLQSEKPIARRSKLAICTARTALCSIHHIHQRNVEAKDAVRHYKT